MNTEAIDDFVKVRLSSILDEMVGQSNLANSYQSHAMSFEEEMDQVREFIAVGEYGLAYESIVVNLEQAPFSLTGASAISLLEVALVMKFKTSRESDDFLNWSNAT
jgi:hypothetical protein